MRRRSSNHNMDRPVCLVCRDAVASEGVSLCACRGSIALLHMGCVVDQVAATNVMSCSVCRKQFAVKRESISGGALLRLYRDSYDADSLKRAAAVKLAHLVFGDKTASEGTLSKVKCALALLALMYATLFCLHVAFACLVHEVAWGHESGHVLSEVAVTIVVFYVLAAATWRGVLAIASRSVVNSVVADFRDRACLPKRPDVDV